MSRFVWVCQSSLNQRNLILKDLDLQHQVWVLTLNNRLYSAPLPTNVKSVVDIACGNGSWPLAMAKERPMTEVIAVDLTQPSLPDLPNLKTVQLDAEEDWPFKQDFTFIHGRMLTSAIRDWPALIRRSWDHLELGGWLEFKDVYPPYRAAIPAADNPSASPLINFGHVTDKGWTANGKDWSTTSKHVQRLQTLGFVNIREEKFDWPLGEWAETEVERRIGALTLQNFAGFFKTAAFKVLMQDPDLDEQEARRITDEARADLIGNCVRNRYYLTV